MAVKIVYWVMTLCSLVGCYQHWEECTTFIFGLEMGTSSLEERSASIFIYQITQCHCPEDHSFWKCGSSQLNHDIYVHKRILVFISSDIICFILIKDIHAFFILCTWDGLVCVALRIHYISLSLDVYNVAGILRYQVTQLSAACIFPFNFCIG